MIKINECKNSSVSSLYQIQFDTPNSFSLLHSVYGYTKTEWNIEKSRDCTFKEFEIFYNNDRCAFLRLKNKDTLSQTFEIQIHCMSRKHIDDITSEIRMVLIKLFNFEHISRFYCYLFPHELIEMEILSALGFHQEAIFDQHIFSKGKYLDLYIFGTERTTIR